MSEKASKPTANETSRSNSANARWRERNKVNNQLYLDAYNSNRALMNLPPVSLKPAPKKISSKGKSRPNYDPPSDIAKNMSQQQLSEWRAKEQLKRRAAKKREYRANQKTAMDLIKAEVVNSGVEVKQYAKINCPPQNEMIKMDKKDLSNWRATARKKRRRQKQVENKLSRKKQVKETEVKLPKSKTSESGPVKSASDNREVVVNQFEMNDDSSVTDFEGLIEWIDRQDTSASQKQSDVSPNPPLISKESNGTAMRKGSESSKDLPSELEDSKVAACDTHESNLLNNEVKMVANNDGCNDVTMDNSCDVGTIRLSLSHFITGMIMANSAANSTSVRKQDEVPDDSTIGTFSVDED